MTRGTALAREDPGQGMKGVPDQVLSADPEYDAEGRLTDGVTEVGTLSASAARYVRCNTWHDSNADLFPEDSAGERSRAGRGGGKRPDDRTPLLPSDL